MHEAMIYPPFDPDARCPKCAYDAVTTKYEYEFKPVPREEIEELGRLAIYLPIPYPAHPERLARACARCSFGWYERPVEVGHEG